MSSGSLRIQDDSQVYQSLVDYIIKLNEKKKPPAELVALLQAAANEIVSKELNISKLKDSYAKQEEQSVKYANDHARLISESHEQHKLIDEYEALQKALEDSNVSYDETMKEVLSMNEKLLKENENLKKEFSETEDFLIKKNSELYEEFQNKIAENETLKKDSNALEELHKQKHNKFVEIIKAAGLLAESVPNLEYTKQYNAMNLELLQLIFHFYKDAFTKLQDQGWTFWKRDNTHDYNKMIIDFKLALVAHVLTTHPDFKPTETDTNRLILGQYFDPMVEKYIIGTDEFPTQYMPELVKDVLDILNMGYKYK